MVEKKGESDIKNERKGKEISEYKCREKKMDRSIDHYKLFSDVNLNIIFSKYKTSLLSINPIHLSQ